MSNGGKDYIPTIEGKFLEWVKFLFTYLAAHAAAWGIDPTSWAGITPLIAAFEAAYERVQDPNHGKADVKAKNDAMKALKKPVRQYVKEYLTNNHLITNEDRERMGLPVHDTTPTPAPVPEDVPIGRVDFSKPLQHLLHVKAGTLTGVTRPPKVLGYEIWRKIGGETPANDDEWVYVNLSSRSTFRISYPQTDRGKTVYYRFRWVNTRYQPGPWNEELVSAVVG